MWLRTVPIFQWVQIYLAMVLTSVAVIVRTGECQPRPGRDSDQGMGKVLGDMGAPDPPCADGCPSLLLAWLQCPDPSPPLLNGHPQPRPVAFAFAWGGRETSGLTSCSPGPPRPASRGCRLLESDAQGLPPSQAGPPPQVRAGAPAGTGGDSTGRQRWWQRSPADR